MSFVQVRCLYDPARNAGAESTALVAAALAMDPLINVITRLQPNVEFSLSKEAPLHS